MITSGFLVFILLFLTASLVVTVIAAWRRAWFNPELALSFVTIGLFLWLWLGTDLPHSLTLLKWSAGGGELIWSLQVDPQSWRSAVYLFLLTIATLLVARPQFKPGDQNQKNSPSQWLALPILLLLMFTGLVAVLADSIAGLASSWTLLTVIWFVFTWTSGQPVTQVRRAMTSGGALLAGVGFLWLAQATLSSSIGRLSPGENWSEPAIVFASLAAMVFLGAIPFHWWRSMNRTASCLPQNRRSSSLCQLLLADRC